MRRVLCDVMLGKLATYLRMCGFDTAYALDRDVEETDAILAWADDEDRTLLTRNAALAGRSPNAIHLAAREPAEQLLELHDAGVTLELPDEPRRCSKCNAELTRVGEDEPRPDYAPPAGEHPAWRCSACGQYYWRGSHWEEIRETLASLDAG